MTNNVGLRLDRVLKIYLVTGRWILDMRHGLMVASRNPSIRNKKNKLPDHFFTVPNLCPELTAIYGFLW